MQKKQQTTRFGRRLQTVEVEVSKLNVKFDGITDEIHKLAVLIRQQQENSRITVPGITMVVLACVTLGGVAMNYVHGNLRPLELTDRYILKEMDRREGKFAEDDLRERHDAAKMATFEERFKTIQTDLDAAIKNRTDRHEKIQAQLADLKEELTHVTTNGLGRRIDEKIAPLAVDLKILREQLNELKGK